MTEKRKNIDKVPNLRFPEFSGEWEVKALGTLADVSKLAGYEFTKHIIYEETGKIIALRGLNIKNNSLDLSDVKYIDNSDLSKLNRSKLFVDDLMFTYIGTIGEVALIEDNDRFYLAPNVSRIRTDKNKVSPNFLLQYFNHPYFKNIEIAKYISSSSQPALTMENVRKFDIKLPLLEEQNKIANFLSVLDSKIKTQRKTIESLESLMKGMSQKLFTRKIRFKEFTDEWKEVRLGKIGETFNGLTGKTKDDFGQGKPYIQYKQIFDSTKIQIQDCELVEISENENQNCVKYGDIFFTTSSETPNEIGMSSVLLDEVDEMYLNSFCFGYRTFSFDILTPLFASFFFRSSIFRNKIVQLAQGSTRYNMSKVEFMKLSISLPFIQEQTKIADFLSKISDKIETEKKILELLEQQKKYFLQNLFI